MCLLFPASLVFFIIEALNGAGKGIGGRSGGGGGGKKKSSTTSTVYLHTPSFVVMLYFAILCSTIQCAVFAI